MSKAEKRIWKALLSRKQKNVRFLRQRSIKNFIVDFFAPEIGLIIEIDGNSHYNKPEYDRYRQDKLEKLGYTFLRFSEGDVLYHLDDVFVQIEQGIRCLREKKCL